MIGQGLLDFFRDVLLNWLSGFDSLLNGINAAQAGGAVGGAAAQSGHFLALFIAPGMWGGIVAAWLAWLGVWLTTGLVAIFARRGKA